MIKGYKIIRNLGEGNFAKIFEVSKDNNLYAMKEISLNNSDNSKIMKIKEEAELLRNLSAKKNSNISNYIVEYIESFEENNKFYIIMEYCDKGDLFNYIEEKKKTKQFLQENEILQFFTQIAIGIGYIHKNNILHRDLKSLNIFLTKEGKIKIGDLGIAKILENEKYTNTFIGTLYYMSPEMCENKSYTFKTDLWSLGCILYELCTFKHPFDDKNPYLIMTKIIKGKFVQINAANKGKTHYSIQLTNLVNNLLNIVPNKRPNLDKILGEDYIIENAFRYNLIDDLKELYPKIKSNIHLLSKKKPCLITKNKKIDNYYQENDKKVLTKINFRINKENKTNINENNISIKKKKKKNKDKIFIKELFKDDMSIKVSNFSNLLKDYDTENKNLNIQNYINDNEEEKNDQNLNNIGEHYIGDNNEIKDIKIVPHENQLKESILNKEKENIMENRNKKLQEIKDLLNEKDYNIIKKYYDKSLLDINNEQTYYTKIFDYIEKLETDLKETFLTYFTELLSIDNSLSQ